MDGITVRPIRIDDLFRFRGVRAEVQSLDQPLGRMSQRIADPMSALPVWCRVHKAFVALENGAPLALLDLRADPVNHRWILTRLATSSRSPLRDERQRERIWNELLVHAVRAAGAARAKRLHVALPEASPVLDILADIGFTTYAQDTLLVAQRLPSGIGNGLARRQDPSDVWSIHQLYHSVTPRPVQYAEALTSNYWDSALPGLVPTRGFVIENGLEIAAHCRVTSAGGRHVMNVMVHPGALDLLKMLIGDVLNDITPSSSDEVIICVPDYLQEYLAPLEVLGFEQGGRQSRLVKYTVVPRRMQAHGIEQVARELPDRVAAGSPTLYLAGGRTTGRSTKSRSRTRSTQDL